MCRDSAVAAAIFRPTAHKYRTPICLKLAARAVPGREDLEALFRASIVVIALLAASHAAMTMVTGRSLHRCRLVIIYPIVGHVVRCLAPAALAVLDEGVRRFGDVLRLARV